MIVAALTAESVETVQSHVEIFKDIKRVHNIVKRYQECQKTKLLQQWKGRPALCFVFRVGMSVFLSVVLITIIVSKG